MANMPMAITPMYSRPAKRDTHAMFFYEQLEKHANEKGLSMYQLHFLAQIDTKNIHDWKTGKRHPSDPELHKLSEVIELELDYSTLKAWYLVGKYGKEEILIASKYLDTL